MFALNPKRKFYIEQTILNKRPADRYEAIDGIIEVYIVAGRKIEIPQTYADKVRAHYNT